MKKTAKNNLRWSDADDIVVDQTTGVPLHVVAAILGRSLQSISNRRYTLGCPRKKRDYAQTAKLKAVLADREGAKIFAAAEKTFDEARADAVAKGTSVAQETARGADAQMDMFVDPVPRPHVDIIETTVMPPKKLMDADFGDRQTRMLSAEDIAVPEVTTAEQRRIAALEDRIATMDAQMNEMAEHIDKPAPRKQPVKRPVKRAGLFRRLGFMFRGK
jgi:hypothetical protein